MAFLVRRACDSLAHTWNDSLFTGFVKPSIRSVLIVSAFLFALDAFSGNTLKGIGRFVSFAAFFGFFTLYWYFKNRNSPLRTDILQIEKHPPVDPR